MLTKLEGSPHEALLIWHLTTPRWLDLILLHCASIQPIIRVLPCAYSINEPASKRIAVQAEHMKILGVEKFLRLDLY